MTTLITWYKNGSGENSFSPHMLIFSGSKRVTPPLLRCGRQPRGSIPLTPLIFGFFQRSSLWYCSLGEYPNGGGGSANVLEPPGATFCLSP